MRGLSVITVAAILSPALVSAHVTVRPRESKPGVEERYTVRVPAEGKVATTSVDFEVPEGVTVTDVPAAAGVAPDLRRDGGRIVAITWTKEIKPADVAEFVFVARNPGGSEIAWKVHQHYADGGVRDWSPSTKLVPLSDGGSAHGEQPGETSAIEAWLKQYDAAFNAKDLDKLGAFYHPEVTIYEGGGVNNGWPDYRDHHLAPELKEFQDLQFSHSNTKVNLLADGSAAYVTSTYAIKARMGERAIDSTGLETLVLVKGSDGSWKIRHSHTSSRPRRAPQP